MQPLLSSFRSSTADVVGSCTGQAIQKHNSDLKFFLPFRERCQLYMCICCAFWMGAMETLMWFRKINFSSTTLPLLS